MRPSIDVVETATFGERGTLQFHFCVLSGFGVFATNVYEGMPFEETFRRVVLQLTVTLGFA
jgi:hypothetical protein